MLEPLQVVFAPPFWVREVRYQNDVEGEQAVFPLRPDDCAAVIHDLGLAIRHADGSTLLVPNGAGRPHKAELDALRGVYWRPI